MLLRLKIMLTCTNKFGHNLSKSIERNQLNCLTTSKEIVAATGYFKDWGRHSTEVAFALLTQLPRELDLLTAHLRVPIAFIRWLTPSLKSPIIAWITKKVKKYFEDLAYKIFVTCYPFTC